MSPTETTARVDGPPTPFMEGLTAVNAARGFVAAIVGKLLADLGMTVIDVRSTRPDQAADLYPAYESLRTCERTHHVEISATGLQPLLSSADLCIVGGEYFPEEPHDVELARRLASGHPSLIVLDIRGYPAGGESAARPAVDILVQARAGLVYEHYPDRPNLMSFQPAQYGAALQGVMGALAALFARTRAAAASGTAQPVGQIVSTSFHEGALTWVTTWNEAERPDIGFNFIVPLDPRPLILKCADGIYVQIILGAANAKFALYQLLGINDPTVKPGDSGAPNRNDPPEKFYGDLDLLGPYIARWNSKELVAGLNKAGVAAMPVQLPGAAWDDPQVRHNRLIKVLPDGREIVGNPVIRAMPGPVTAPREPPSSLEAMPLAGVRVLDFGAFTAGPLASLFLRKLGADVIKVEPLSGDPARNMPRAFMASNRGKRSIAVDMKAAKGRQLVERLCAGADVVASNFRPGVAAKLGIDGETLIARQPRVIVLEAPAFGRTGPRANETAFDLVLQAFCGFEARAGGVGNKPLWNRTFLADYGGGQLGAIAVLAALCHRQRTGRGSVLEVSLLSGAFFLQSEIMRRPDGSFAGAQLLNSAQTGFHPAECLYQARDGWLAVAVRSDAAAQSLCRVLGLSQTDPTGWRCWDEHTRAAIQAAIAGRDVDELLHACGESADFVEKCMRDREHCTLNDPHLMALGTVERAPHSQYGLISQLGSLFRLSRSPLAMPGITPHLGEHTAGILKELGYSDSEAAALGAERVVA